MTSCETFQKKRLRNRHILPLWKAVCYKEIVDNYYYTFDIALCPDYGGTGVDIVFDDNDKTISCETIKIENDSQFTVFRAKDYCLPFIKPNKIPHLSDPCLKVIERHLINQDSFCNKLSWCRYRSKTPKLLPVLEECYENLKVFAEGNYERDTLKIPKHVVNLLNLYPDPFPTLNSNWLYTGGCLSSGPGLTLSYSCGPRTETIAFAKLQEHNLEKEKVFSIKNVKTVPLSEKTKIHQIIHQEIFQQNFWAVRKKCQFYIFSTVEKIDDLETNLLATHHSSELLSSIAISPHIPGEILSSTNCGYIQLQSLNSNEVVWKTEKNFVHENSNNLANDWWVADFGPCPRSLLCLDRTNFTKTDMRTKKANSQMLLSQSSPFLHGEELSLFKGSLLNNLQYFVACSNHLALIDERFPQKPIHLWNHNLETMPLYCTQTIIEKENQLLFLLSTQNSSETSCLQLDSKSETIQPISLGSMWHTASPSDFVKIARLQGEFFPSEIQIRTALPVIGVEVIPHSTNSGFTVFQLTSVGDLYYQDYIPFSDARNEKTFHCGSGCKFLDRESSLSKCSDWIKEAFVKARPSNDDEEKVPQMSFKISNAYKLLFSGCNSSDTCPVCFENSKLIGVDDRKTCPGCGLDESTTFKILKVKEKGGIISKYDYLNEGEKPKLDLIDLNRTYDPLSTKMLSVWLDKSKGQSDDLDREHEEVFASLLHPSPPVRVAKIVDEMATPSNKQTLGNRSEPSSTAKVKSLVEQDTNYVDSDEELLETPKRAKRTIKSRKNVSSVGF